MNLLQQHTKVDLTAVLRAEIELLRNDPLIDKSRMNKDSFNPVSNSCFMGQIFGADCATHRNKVGRIALDSDPGLDGRFGGVTPLEIWSAEEWKKGNKAIVLAVFDYINAPPMPDLRNVQWDPTIKIM